MRSSLPRTERDIPMTWLLLGSIAILLILWLSPNLPMNFFTILLLLILGFFFVAVTSITVGLIGTTSNPTSGMTLTTLLLTCIAFLLLGWTERIYLLSALMMGSVACCAIALAGTTSQDLKTGFLLGATPRSQQIGELFGVFLPALALGYVIYILNKAYHLGSPELPAPQATLMTLVVNGVMTHQIPYPIVGIGALLGLIVGLLRIPIMPFAVGLYLPLSLSMAIFVGGLLKEWMDRRKFHQEREQRGILFASGLIGGDACMGILTAILAVAGILSPSAKALLPSWVSPLMYGALGALLLWITSRKERRQ